MRLICVALAVLAARAALPRYEVDTTFAPQWGATIQRMTAAAFSDGQVFAVERGPDQPYASLVHVLSPTGKALFDFGKGVIETAHGAHIGETPEGARLFITDTGDFTVKVFDFTSGTLLRTFGEPHKEGTSLDPIQFG